MARVKIETDPILGEWAISYPDGPLSPRDQIRRSVRHGYFDPDRPFTRQYSWADGIDFLERREREYALVAKLLTDRRERAEQRVRQLAKRATHQQLAALVRRPPPPRLDPARTPLTTRGPDDAPLRVEVPEGAGV